MAVLDEVLRDEVESALADASAAVDTGLGFMAQAAAQFREAREKLATISLAVANAEVFEATA